jgi:hypothetical protein
MIASSARHLARMASEAPWRSLPRSAASAFHSGNVKNMSPHLRTKLPPLINTASGPMGTYLKTATDIAKGQTVLSCTGELVARPTVHTVQVRRSQGLPRFPLKSHAVPGRFEPPHKLGSVQCGALLSFSARGRSELHAYRGQERRKRRDFPNCFGKTIGNIPPESGLNAHHLPPSLCLGVTILHC